MPKDRIRPKDVDLARAKRILRFLNNVGSASELARAVGIIGERDLGLKVAERILSQREMLGKFTELQQVIDIDQVGPDRFTDIITASRKFARYAGSRHAIFVDGSSGFGVVNSVSGGTIRGELATRVIGPNRILRKQVGSIVYDDFEIEVGLDGGKGILDWIAASFDGGVASRSGEIHDTDFDYYSRSVREFHSSQIVEVTLPASDGQSLV